MDGMKKCTVINKRLALPDYHLAGVVSLVYHKQHDGSHGITQSGTLVNLIEKGYLLFGGDEHLCTDGCLYRSFGQHNRNDKLRVEIDGCCFAAFAHECRGAEQLVKLFLG